MITYYVTFTKHCYLRQLKWAYTMHDFRVSTIIYDPISVISGAVAPLSAPLFMFFISMISDLSELPLSVISDSSVEPISANADVARYYPMSIGPLTFLCRCIRHV